MATRAFSVLLALAALTAGACTCAQAPLRGVKTIALPGVEGRIDHMAADARGGRLFVAALGNNTLEVVDLRAGKRTHSLSGFSEPQGVAYMLESHRICVANGQGGTLRILDGGTFSIVRDVKLGDDADNVRYDLASRKLYAGYGAGAIGVVDSSGGLAGSTPLPAHPESFQLEVPGPHIYVNVPDAGQVAVVDRAAGRVVAAWRLRDVGANFPMALDESHRRLFIGCRRPAALLVLDTADGREVARLPLSGDTDDLWYDAARKRIYASCGEGYLDAFQQTDADHYARIAHLATAPGARTCTFVPDSSLLCLAVPHRGSHAAEIRVYQAVP